MTGNDFSAPALTDHTSQGTPEPQGAPHGNTSGPSTNRPTGVDHDQRTDSDGSGGNEPEARRFTQEEVDRIAAKRADKAERRAEQRVMRLMGAQARQAEPRQPEQQQAAERPLRREDFANEDDYIDARVERGLAKGRAEQQQAQRQAESQRIVERVEAAYRDAEAIEGFSREDYDDLELTTPIVHAVLETDRATRGRLMHYMQANPDEVSRIARLPTATAQARAIGRIEARLEGDTSGRAANPSTDAERPAPSRAPRPTSTVGGGNAGQTVGDLSRGTMADYVRQRARQGAPWAKGR